MKLASDALLEVLETIQHGIATLSDVSEKLRQIDLEEYDGQLRLSDSYLLEKGRRRADL